MNNTLIDNTHLHPYVYFIYTTFEKTNAIKE